MNIKQLSADGWMTYREFAGFGKGRALWRFAVRWALCVAAFGCLESIRAELPARGWVRTYSLNAAQTNQSIAVKLSGTKSSLEAPHKTRMGTWIIFSLSTRPTGINSGKHVTTRKATTPPEPS
jgi:hypothetical protein